MTDDVEPPPARKSLATLAGEALLLQTSEGVAISTVEGREGLLHELGRIRTHVIATNAGAGSMTERLGIAPTEDQPRRFVPSEDAVPQLRLLLEQTLPRMQASSPLMRDDEQVIGAAVPPKGNKTDTSFLMQLALMLREEAEHMRAQPAEDFAMLDQGLTDRPADIAENAHGINVAADGYEHEAMLLGTLQDRVQACAQLMPKGRGP